MLQGPAFTSSTTGAATVAARPASLAAAARPSTRRPAGAKPAGHAAFPHSGTPATAGRPARTQAPRAPARGGPGASSRVSSSTPRTGAASCTGAAVAATPAAIVQGAGPHDLGITGSATCCTVGRCGPTDRAAAARRRAESSGPAAGL